jgi:hypothetical protein
MLKKNVYLWFSNLSPSSKAFVSAFTAIVGFAIGAFLENRVQLVVGDQPGDFSIGLLWIILSVIIAAFWGLLHFSYRHFLETHKDMKEKDRRVIEDARERITKLTLQQLTHCDAIMESENVPIDQFRSIFICEIERINSLVAEAWEVVNSHHNVSDSPTERINFELTLITPSIRDSELTVASWRRRDNRRPLSLLKRDEGKKDIYQRTEAAKMMANNITDTRIIEDTSVPSENYESLYDGQKERIRSSVLHPILSPKSKPLGVLVLHCEIKEFFKVADRRYWHELLSVFAPSIALEIERINAYNKTNSLLSIPIEKYQPY